MERAVFTVRQARNMAGKTQTEIANSLGICLETYRKLERCPEKMTIEQAKMFCREVSRQINEVSFFTTNSN